ncbi:UNKNOWN [Stylonychia lemnae]|uniref:Uncharacterized protein n=1 Tax=Stylonychia lemnae TaxID=5949 RepID=A0A077ZVF5_STYLE|nr:UNKNOWN [Stylonychia lemnae]|eukprot:CDW73614.1 UNKNOWN [Stylonychia lemnae]
MSRSIKESQPYASLLPFGFFELYFDSILTKTHSTKSLYSQSTKIPYQDLADKSNLISQVLKNQQDGSQNKRYSNNRPKSSVYVLIPSKNQKRIQIPRESETFKNIMDDSKKIKVSQIKLEEIISDVKNGQVPDFGLPDQLNYSDDRPGWHLFTTVISPKGKNPASLIIIHYKIEDKINLLFLKFLDKFQLKEKLISNQQQNILKKQGFKMKKLIPDHSPERNLLMQHLRNWPKSFSTQRKKLKNYLKMEKLNLRIDTSTRLGFDKNPIISPSTKKKAVKFADSLKEKLNPQQLKMFEVFKQYVDENFEDRQSARVMDEIRNIKGILKQNNISPRILEQYVKMKSKKEDVFSPLTSNRIQMAKSQNSFLSVSTPRSALRIEQQNTQRRQLSLFGHQFQLEKRKIESDTDSCQTDSISEESNDQIAQSDDNNKTDKIKNKFMPKKPKEYYQFLKQYPGAQKVNQQNVKQVLSTFIQKLKNLKKKFLIKFELLEKDIQKSEQRCSLKLKIELISDIIKMLRAKKFELSDEMQQKLIDFKLERVSDTIKLIYKFHPVEVMQQEEPIIKPVILIKKKINANLQNQVNINSKRSKTPMIRITAPKVHSNERKSQLSKLDQKLSSILSSQHSPQGSPQNNYMLNIDESEDKTNMKLKSPKRSIQYFTQQNSPNGYMQKNFSFDKQTELKVHLKHQPKIKSNNFIDRLQPLKRSYNNSNLESNTDQSERQKMSSVRQGSTRVDENESLKSELPPVYVNSKLQRTFDNDRQIMTTNPSNFSKKPRQSEQTQYNVDFLKKIMISIAKENVVKEQLDNSNYNRDSNMSQIKNRNIKTSHLQNRNKMGRLNRSILTTSDYI